MRVHKFDEVPSVTKHRAALHILMDAGELGSRHMCVHWVEVPVDATFRGLSPDGDGEQFCVFVSGSGTIASAGQTRSVGRGDLVFMPPASEFAVRASGDESLVYVCAISPQEAYEELEEVEQTGDLGEYLDADEQ